MKNRKLGFEWQNGEEEWQTRYAGHLTEASGQLRPLAPKQWSWRWRLIVVPLLLCLLGAGGWLWRTAHAGLSTLQQELAATVQLEFWTAAQGRSGMPDGMIDEQASTTWRRHFEHEFTLLNAPVSTDTVSTDTVGIDAARTDAAKAVPAFDLQLIDMQEGVALVQMVTNPNTGGPAYRQSRFYLVTQVVHNLHKLITILALNDHDSSLNDHSIITQSSQNYCKSTCFPTPPDLHPPKMTHPAKKHDA